MLSIAYARRLVVILGRVSGAVAAQELIAGVIATDNPLTRLALRLNVRTVLDHSLTNRL
jgi:hypothetical protein